MNGWLGGSGSTLAPGQPPARGSGRRAAEHPAVSHLVCLVRILLLLPVVACVVLAWLAAAGLATLWLLLTGPRRRPGGATRD